MKTIGQLISRIKQQEGVPAFITTFLDKEEMKDLGIQIENDYSVKEFNRDNVLEILKSDVGAGLAVINSNRGISLKPIFTEVAMLNWVLDEGLGDQNVYSQYGLPLFNATAEKYGFVYSVDNTEPAVQYQGDF